MAFGLVWFSLIAQSRYRLVVIVRVFRLCMFVVVYGL